MISMIRAPRILMVIAMAVLGASAARSQQVVDSDFRPTVAAARWPSGKGPRVAIDEAHENFHTATGGYAPFAALLRADGFRVIASTTPFSAETLKDVDILVVANARSRERTAGGFAASLPAYTTTEIAAVHAWVENGGALLLIADHMPFAASSATLGAAFGVTAWSNGYALSPRTEGLITFRAADGSLAAHEITRGRDAGDRVESVMTFTGSAFQAPSAQPLLTFAPGTQSWLPEVPGQLRPSTPKVDIGGWQQGAVDTVGKGRVALFGEAAMFTAQRVGPARAPAGLNAPGAEQNAQFVLNVMRWLAATP